MSNYQKAQTIIFMNNKKSEIEKLYKLILVRVIILDIYFINRHCDRRFEHLQVHPKHRSILQI